MNKNIKTDALLLTNAVLSGFAEKRIVLCLIDVAVLECRTMFANISGLWERADGGGGKQG
jgi:hypothetical protein